MHESFEVKYWNHRLGASRERLQQVVDKVGNFAATVRKELGELTAVSHLARFQQSGRQLRSRTAQLTYANAISSN